MPSEADLKFLQDMKNATREGRELLKDMKNERRLATEFVATFQGRVGAQIEAELKKQLDELEPAVGAQMDASVRTVMNAFQRLEDIFLGKGKDGRTLEEAAIQNSNRRARNNG
jgi:hypothetical protein